MNETVVAVVGNYVVEGEVNVVDYDEKVECRELKNRLIKNIKCWFKQVLNCLDKNERERKCIFHRK